MESATLASPLHTSFPERIDLYAELAVRAGLGLQQGQELVITAPLDAVTLVRRITEHAYRAGASLVTTFYVDDEATLARYRYAPDGSFDYAAAWLYDGIAAAYRSGAARLGITGTNPALLGGQDPAKIARANVALSRVSKPAMELITRHEINWSIVAAATPAWAKIVFPEADETTAMERLWDAIFAASRLNNEDPIAAWREHGANLQHRAALLNAKRYSALKYTGPGTNLEIGLADGHLWLGGGTTALNGIACQPNIPTEEVFTTPHRERVHGTVRATKPLSYQGTLIEDISVRFEKGAVVEAHARTGESVLQQMIGTDEGARRLGEVALVPHSSPISSSGLLFSNTLFDENAACHIAMGQAYSTCLEGGDTLSPEQLKARGANESLIHVDWMIGSGELDIDGVTASGTQEPLMRRGEWV